MALIIALAKKAGFLFGRTAVRPYKKNMILNMITDQEDRYAALRFVPGAKAPASLPWMLLRASLPAQQHHFFKGSLPAMRPMFYKASLLLLRYPRPKTRDPLLIFLFSLFLSPYLFFSLSLFFSLFRESGDLKGVDSSGLLRLFLGLLTSFYQGDSIHIIRIIYGSIIHKKHFT